jgi:threonine/homoserine/homoserine lactone efflux protein
MFLVPVILFAISATLTPGPNNALVMGSAFNFGVLRSLPLLFGMCLGFPALLLTVSAGLDVVLQYVPDFLLYLRVIGSAYLLYLAYKIFNISSLGEVTEVDAPLGFLHGAAFQWVNPKSWIVAISAVSSFSFLSESQLVNGLILSAVFVVISLPCVGTWMIAGGSIRRILNTPTRIAWFNRIMALLLVGSVIQAFFV